MNLTYLLSFGLVYSVLSHPKYSQLSPTQTKAIQTEVETLTINRKLFKWQSEHVNLDSTIEANNLKYQSILKNVNQAHCIRKLGTQYDTQPLHCNFTQELGFCQHPI